MRKYLSITLLILWSMLGCKNAETKPEVETPTEMPDTPFVTVAFEAKAELGEGAFWNYKTQQLYWIDILGKQLHLLDPLSKNIQTFNLPSRIGTVVPQTDSTAVVALEDGIYLQNTKNDSLDQLTPLEADQPGNRFNDGKCDPAGNLWVGSMDLAEKNPVAKLYKVTPQGVATAMLDSITISNGIVWTKDGRTMYYTDTPTGKIRAYDFDPWNATLSNERVAVEVPVELGFPDGMTIDSDDMLWVALWNGNAVVRFDPKTGEILQKIEVPAHNVSSCAFGGPNLDILYITSARVDMSEAELEAFPLAGSVFEVKPGVHGVKSTFFGTPK
ncbi:MAG: SMP-30/gluconolactonase/LRE family protein [Flavobacteriaceae bacterium]